MNNAERKGQSPFYPGQPVPVELFVGRKAEIARIERATNEVAHGKPQAIFIAGEYGIGKSSLAHFVRVLAQEFQKLLGFHFMLGTADSLEDLAIRTVQTILESSVTQPTVSESIGNFLADYVGEQSLFGITLHLDKLRQDAPDISRGYLPFLRKLYEQAEKGGYKGLLIIFDEINGLANKEVFARFLKNLIDENALSNQPLPILVVLCGTEERRQEIIDRHRPVERIFEVAQIEPMNQQEMQEFFEKAFRHAGMSINEDAMWILTHYSGGLPKLMHIVGDAAFWIAQQSVITKEVARQAIFAAAEDVGRKFVAQKLYHALRSKDYHRILAKLAKHDFDLVFKKGDIERGLSEEERHKFSNFLQRMKRLNVLTSGEQQGEYVFYDRLTRLYLRMEAILEKRQ